MTDFDFAAAPGGNWPAIVGAQVEQEETPTQSGVQEDAESGGTSSAQPTGSIVAYGGTAAPTGWLLCNGSAVSRTTFGTLFGVLGTAFGSGDGSTTFNLPNLQQRFPLGKATSGTGSTLGGTGGTVDHAHSSTGAHEHSWSFSGNSGSASAGPGQGGGGTPTDLTRIAHTHSISSSGSTFGGPGNHSHGSANPPFQTVNYIIKT